MNEFQNCFRRTTNSKQEVRQFMHEVADLIADFDEEYHSHSGHENFECFNLFLSAYKNFYKDKKDLSVSHLPELKSITMEEINEIQSKMIAAFFVLSLFKEVEYEIVKKAKSLFRE